MHYSAMLCGVLWEMKWYSQGYCHGDVMGDVFCLLFVTSVSFLHWPSILLEITKLMPAYQALTCLQKLKQCNQARSKASDFWVRALFS